MANAFVFPGQGSQTVGMGADLFDAYPDEVASADETLGYSIRELCLEDPEGVLGQTAYTQPALYTVNALSYLKAVDELGTPDYVAGHSLGEYNALFAAGVFDFATGLKLVQRRGAIMGEAEGGGMAAVIGLDVDVLAAALADAGGTVDMANFNSPGQIVISGMKSDVEACKEAIEAAGARMFVPLNVSGAFHSRYMADAAATFRTFLESCEIGNPQIPVIANLTARPYEAEGVVDTLAQQICSPVKWSDSINHLLDQDEELAFHEIGPGNVLSKLLRQIRKGR